MEKRERRGRRRRRELMVERGVVMWVTIVVIDKPN